VKPRQVALLKHRRRALQVQLKWQRQRFPALQRDGLPGPEQNVDLHNGQESQVEFKLQAQGALAIHHGVAGSQVLVDGNRIGTVRADGEFSTGSIEAGKHSISIRHEHYKPLQSDQVLAAGKSVDLDGALESLPGTLKIEFSPEVSDAHVRLRRQGDSKDRDVKETTLSLAEGTYTVMASAPRYQDATVTVHVSPDSTAVATLSMNGIPAKSAVPVASANDWLLNDWLKTGGWTHDGQALTRKGGDFVMVPLNLADANIQFTALGLHGKHLAWVEGFRDAKNYYLFQMDDTNFSRTEIVDGKHLKTVKIPHLARRDTYVTLNVEITPSGIRHSIARDQQWHTLDDWQPAGGPKLGKFGFYVQGHDEIALSDFRLNQK
jgi:hypothetical protein